MTRKIGIIGDGHVGSTVAHYIVTNGFADDLVLIDKNEAKVNADAIDFRSNAQLPFHTNITVNDYAALKDADVIISALGNIRLNDGAKEDRFLNLLTIVNKLNPWQLRSVIQALMESSLPLLIQLM